MKNMVFRVMASIALIGCWHLGAQALAASANPSLMKAKQNAEARGVHF